MTARNGKPMKESAAWKVIARGIAKGQWDRDGLCCTVDNLFYCGTTRFRVGPDGGYAGLQGNVIDRETKERMNKRIAEHMDPLGRGWSPTFAFPEGQVSVRVLAALFLSYEAADEEEAP